MAVETAQLSQSAARLEPSIETYTPNLMATGKAHGVFGSGTILIQRSVLLVADSTTVIAGRVIGTDNFVVDEVSRCW